MTRKSLPRCWVVWRKMAWGYEPCVVLKTEALANRWMADCNSNLVFVAAEFREVPEKRRSKRRSK